MASTGGKPTFGSPQALPSPSLGNSPPTDLLVSTCAHMLVNTAMTSSRPQKKWKELLNGFHDAGSPGLACWPMNQGCQGATVEMQGTSSASQVVVTGLVVSGVEATSIRLISSSTISSRATSAARLGLDWLSLTITSTSMPAAFAAALKPSMMKPSASAKAASGPVCGLT